MFADRAGSGRCRCPRPGMTGASVMVALPAEGLRASRAGAGPLRHRAAAGTPVGVAVRVRAPVPARAVRPAARWCEGRPLGPAVGVVLPCLAAAGGRPVEQAERAVDPLVAAAGRRVDEERAVAIAQEAGDGTHAVA